MYLLGTRRQDSLLGIRINTRMFLINGILFLLWKIGQDLKRRKTEHFSS